MNPTFVPASDPLFPVAAEPAPAASPAPVVLAPPAPLVPARSFALVDELLRDRTMFLRRLAESDDLLDLARTMLVTIFLCCAAFGIALGLTHGGWQVLFAAVKLPLAVLFTAGLTAPALSAMQQVMRGGTDVRRDFALILGSLAFGTVVLASLAPVMVLAHVIGVGYHDTILLTVGCCGVAGLATLALFRRGLREGGTSSRAVLWTVMLVFALVGSQISWTLRPFLAHPTGEVTFLRPLEGGLVDSVSTSFDSSRGIYREEIVR